MIVKILLCHFDKIFKFVSQNDVLSHTDHLCLHFVTCSKGRWPNWPQIHFKWSRISNFFFLPIFRNCIVTLIVAFMCRFLHHRDMLKKKIIACLSFYQYLLFSNHKVLFSILFGSFNIRLHVHNHCKTVVQENELTSLAKIKHE